MHNFIIGQTGSGKSHFAKDICRAFRRAGRNTLVLDPMANLPGCLNDWGATWVTANVEQFCAVAFQNKNCALFVDECGQVIGLHPPPEVEALATTSRHYEHQVFFIAQRGVQVSKTMRDQSSGLFLFNVSYDDAEEWARIYNDEMLRLAPKLPQYHYIAKRRFQEAAFCKPIRG